MKEANAEGQRLSAESDSLSRIPSRVTCLLPFSGAAAGTRVQRDGQERAHQMSFGDYTTPGTFLDSSGISISLL